MAFWDRRKNTEQRPDGQPKEEKAGCDLLVCIVDRGKREVTIRVTGEALPEQVENQLWEEGHLDPEFYYRFTNWPRSKDPDRFYCYARELKGYKLVLSGRVSPQRPPVCYYGCPNTGRVYDSGMPAQQKEILNFEE